MNRHLSCKTLNFVNFSECEQAWCGHNFCPTGPPEACIFLKHIFLFHVFVFFARSSFAPAAVAFAAATAGSSNPRDLPSGVRNNNNTGHLCKRMVLLLYFPENLLGLVPRGGQAQDVHHELGCDHEGAVSAETLGHQARPGEVT